MLERTMLLVDDNVITLRLLAAQLRNLGVGEFVACASGAEAIQMVETQPGLFGVILLDLQMPSMDGVEVLRRLADLGFAGAVVLLSAEEERVLHAARVLAIALGLDVIAALQKPISVASLGNALRALRVMSTLRAAAPAVTDPDALRRAITNNELINVYQPKVNLRTGAFSGVEALVRWEHPTLGLLRPEQFIALAEEHQLIRALALDVFRRALDQITRWRLGSLQVGVAVNLSVENLTDLGFPDTLAAEARARGISPDSLVLEVTERRLMADPRAAIDILTRLKLKRFRLSIDDFGAGHSSLSQLRDLPFDELKIDRGFVHGMGSDPSLEAIVGASCTLARDLHMNVVAEGVEDVADWAHVKQSGCDEAQGYFIARPMPGDALPAWVKAWRAPADGPAGARLEGRSADGG